MSIIPQRPAKQSQITAQMPSPPRSSVPSRVGLPPVSSKAPLQFAPQVHGREDGGSSAMDLLRHRVLPAAGLGGHHPQFNADPLQEDNDEFSGAKNSGSYFINLMSNGPAYAPVYAAAAAGLPDENPPQDPAPAVVKDKRRSKNFSDEEDKLLVSAWLNVTLDGIKGVDQTRSTYWKRIHDYFRANKQFISDRSQGSLMNRWSGIQHDVNIFAGCLSRIEARNHSGWSIDDKIASACAMFKEEDKAHRNFAYMHCWKTLKDKPKWMERRNHSSTPASKKQKISTDVSPSAAAIAAVGGNVDGGQPSQGAQERPAGKKKEKQRLWQHASMEAMEYLVAKKKEAHDEKDWKKEERCKKAFALQEERIKIEKEKVEFKMKLEQERIMNMDTSSLSYKLQQFYEEW